MKVAEVEKRTGKYLKKEARLRPTEKDSHVGKDTLKKSNTGEGVG
jgi:hypothetical protein